MKKIHQELIDEYIEKINRLLPYPKETKQDALEILRSDVSAALADVQDGDPSSTFGKPIEVAKDILEGQEWHHQRAGWGIRFIAWGIDLFLKLGFAFLILAIGFGLMLIIMPFDELIQEFAKWETSEFNEIIASPTTFISILTIIPATLIFMAYNIVLEYFFSATIGKKLLGLRAVDHSGIKMVGRQVIIRNLSKIVFGEFLILDVVLGMILEKQTPERTQNQRGLDILAETIVIRV
ncbi:MAG: RDD family protein [Candidatus Heimdallarchaeota archaeon]|nr:RDD family protein [Candidatus Heimdallarchaeota archaeon]